MIALIAAARRLIDRIENALIVPVLVPHERPRSLREMSTWDPRRPICCAWCNTEHCLTHCIWCGTNCNNETVVHADDCPETLGIYPVHETEHLACSECDQIIDDHYTHIEICETNTFGIGLASTWVEIVCLGCSANHQLKEQP